MISAIISLYFFMLWCATLDKSFSLNVIPKQFQTSFYFRSPVSLSALTAATEVISSDIHVIVNGLPGPMALETAKACIDRGYRLLPFGFTGPSGTPSCLVQGKTSQVDVQLIKGPGIDTENAYSKLREWKSKYPSLVVIDYTHPSATLENAKCYSATNCDFVMGTTGGDPTELVRTVETSSITAVIAPNMGKQIVAMQAILQQMSKRFPGSFLGYDLSVTESHQSSKADTSGTAKAVVSYLSDLNSVQFDVEDIKMLRDTASQITFGVPENSLLGHAFHTYRLSSADGSVLFELKHNVCGRRVYAEGTADAVQFVNSMRAKQTSGKRIYNMIDVLESGMI